MNEGRLATNAESEAEIDASLLARIAARDQQAMTQLFERHSRLVYSVALRVLGDRESAEDVLQEVFMQIWRRPVAYNAGRGSLHSLLAVMARNRAIDDMRRHRPTQPVEDLPLASSVNLAATSEQSILLQRVREVASGMSAEQQTALNLAFFEGLTHTEIAKATGMPLGTVKTRIRAAVELLGRTLYP